MEILEVSEEFKKRFLEIDAEMARIYDVQNEVNNLRDTITVRSRKIWMDIEKEYNIRGATLHWNAQNKEVQIHERPELKEKEALEKIVGFKKTFSVGKETLAEYVFLGGTILFFLIFWYFMFIK